MNVSRTVANHSFNPWDKAVTTEPLSNIFIKILDMHVLLLYFNPIYKDVRCNRVSYGETQMWSILKLTYR